MTALKAEVTELQSSTSRRVRDAERAAAGGAPRAPRVNDKRVAAEGNRERLVIGSAGGRGPGMEQKGEGTCS